jgi:LmbE family N-acetylglucosaminyl deacetylase
LTVDRSARGLASDCLPPALYHVNMTSQTVQVTPPGQPASAWDEVRVQAPVFDVERLRHVLGVESLPATLVVAGAHPDDETFGCGRLISQWSRLLGPVVSVLATRGEACLDHVAERPPELGDVRIAEWHRATTRLGVTVRHTFDLPDGQLTLRRSELTDSIRAVVAELEAASARPIVLAASYRGDPHPDHQAVGLTAASVAADHGLALIEYPIWMTFWMQPTEREASRFGVVDVDDEADRAFADASACYVSQLEPLLPHLGPVVPAEMLEHHRRQMVLLPPADKR